MQKGYKKAIVKKSLFFKNAKLLNKKFDIVPLMYGSLGLEYITGEDLNADDIDILIPQQFLNEHWNEFKNVLEGEGYTLYDEHEHTFKNDDVSYSYASIEELEIFGDIKISDINEHHDSDTTFKILTLEQYLKVYSTSIKDGYRINIRQKKDQEKIEIIKRYL